MKSLIRIQTSKGKDGKWYWHARAINGKIVADGAEGYATRVGARKGCRRFLDHIVRGEYNFESVD